MGFLLKRDYYAVIRKTDLDTLLDDGDDDIRERAEAHGIEEVSQHIRHRYDVDAIFIDITVFDPAGVTYVAGDYVAYPSEDDSIYTPNPDDLPAAGENPKDNPTKWIEGDPRNKELVQKLVDIVLYHLHAFNPRTTPEIRRVRYDGDDAQQRGGALGWLMKVQRGKITPDLPEIDTEEKTGYSIRRGGDNIKQDNTY